MIRSVLISALVFCVPMAATADKPRDPRVEEILKDLPSREEIQDVLAKMPDMNKMVGGLREIVEDPETQATLKQVRERLEARFSKLDLEVADGEMPDLNLIMGEVMTLATDKETMGDMLGLMFQVVDVLEESVGEQP